MCLQGKYIFFNVKCTQHFNCTIWVNEESGRDACTHKYPSCALYCQIVPESGSISPTVIRGGYSLFTGGPECGRQGCQSGFWRILIRFLKYGRIRIRSMLNFAGRIYYQRDNTVLKYHIAFYVERKK